MSSSNPTIDKFELHFRQQLSALMDSELPPDEARFLLRRLRHDEELNAQWERWQLLGDALRGQVLAPAPAGFAGRVAAALAAEPAIAASAAASPGRSRGLVRWGGALAASVALVALFVVRQQAPDEVEPAAVAAIPAAEPVAAPVESVVPSEPAISLADAAEPDAAPTVASVTPNQAVAARRSATRTQQAARRVAAARAQAPRRATGTLDAAAQPVAMAEQAASGPAVAGAAHDPFSGAAAEVQQAHVPARPWPRSVLQPNPATGGFTASYGGQGDAAPAFHPFEPRMPALPESPPIELPAEPAQD